MLRLLAGGSRHRLKSRNEESPFNRPLDGRSYPAAARILYRQLPVVGHTEEEPSNLGRANRSLTAAISMGRAMGGNLRFPG